MSDGAEIAVEIDNPAGNILKRYVRGDGMDELLVEYVGSGTANRRFLSSDERGSIISVTDSSGTVLALNKYDEFGVPQSTNLGRFGYTGQAWLPEIGLWYYKARFYRPDIGRFMQTDPIGYEDSPNLYAYVLNDPVNFVDPTGSQIDPNQLFDPFGRVTNPVESNEHELRWNPLTGTWDVAASQNRRTSRQDWFSVHSSPVGADFLQNRNDYLMAVYNPMYWNAAERQRLEKLKQRPKRAAKDLSDGPSWRRTVCTSLFTATVVAGYPELGMLAIDYTRTGSVRETVSRAASPAGRKLGNIFLGLGALSGAAIFIGDIRTRGAVSAKVAREYQKIGVYC